MTGKSEHIVSYTAEEVRERLRRGDDQSRRMDREEALRLRRADPEAPRPYPGWEETITVELPQPKQQITLRLDADMLRWFRARGRGYQTLINAVLRGYYEHEQRKEPGRGR
jgi:uncharacterized protein (DUF4415 family)